MGISSVTLSNSNSNYMYTCTHTCTCTRCWYGLIYSMKSLFNNKQIILYETHRIH